MPRILSTITLLIAFCVTSLSSHAQPAPTIGPEAGQNLAAQLLSIRPVKDFHWTGALNIFHRETQMPSVPIQCQTISGETNWHVVYSTAATGTNGAEKLAIHFFTNAPPQYFYARAAAPGQAVGEAQLLTGAQADIPLAGSDFWLSDLGFEFYHWPVQNELKGQTRRSRGCHVLESINPHPNLGGYARVLTWVDAESLQPLQAEAYGADGKIMKEFEIGSVEKINDHYEVKNLKMFDRRTKSRTSLDFNVEEK